MTRPSAGGRIEVICGCMFSGKTEELLRRIRQLTIARQSFQIFSPRFDTRYSQHRVTSHIGRTFEAVSIQSITEIPDQVAGVQVVAIDELHFLPDTPAQIGATCQQLANEGRRVIVAGLDQNYRAEPFEALGWLLALADRVDKLSAICVCCGAFATRSQRLIDGQPAPLDAPTLVVGGQELYEARCRTCFVPPR